MDVNALQLLRNRIADNRDDAYESLSHIRVHDGQPVVFRYYHTKEDGEREIRALVAIGYNTKVWGRETFKIIWDDVYIEDQINLLFKMIKKIGDTLGDDFLDPDNPDDPFDPSTPPVSPTVAERIRAAITEVKLNNEPNTTAHLTLVHTTEDPGDQHNIYTLGLVDVASETELNAEINRAKAAEQQLQTNIDAEAARAKTAEQQLQINIDAEQARAEAGEAAATTEVSRNETSPNTVAHLVVSPYIGSKLTNTNYVLTLNDVASEAALNQEIQDRKDGDTTLNTKIDNVNTTLTNSLNALTTRVTTAETNIIDIRTDIQNKYDDLMEEIKDCHEHCTAYTDSMIGDLKIYVDGRFSDLDVLWEAFTQSVWAAISSFRASVSNDLDAMTEIINNLQADLNALKLRVTNNETNISNLQGRMSTAETNIDDLITWLGKVANALKVADPLNEFLTWNSGTMASGSTYNSLNYLTNGKLDANHGT